MFRRAPALTLVLSLLAGCPSEQPVDCTTNEVPSITLTVVDPNGAAIADATATYSVRGASADCDSTGDGGFMCGYEVAGEFEVTVSAEGFQTSSFTQVVEEDECHVITEVVEHVLQPIECTDNALPSVRVTVTDDQETSITTASVSWNMTAEDDLNDPCTHLADNVWTCGEEVAGELVVEVVHPGYDTWRQELTVEADECHVITEDLDAVLVEQPVQR